MSPPTKHLVRIPNADKPLALFWAFGLMSQSF